MDRGSWRAAVCGVPNGQTGLSDSTHAHTMSTRRGQVAFEERDPVSLQSKDQIGLLL